MKRPWDPYLERADIFVPRSHVAPGCVLLRADESKFGPGWLAFCEPSAVLVAKAREDVRSVLASVEEAALQGRFAVGFLSYESSPAFDPAFTVAGSNALPLAWFGVYERFEFFKELARVLPSEPARWTPTIDRETFGDRFEAIRVKLAAGHTYQVNFTYRLRTEAEGDLFDEFALAVGSDPPPYAAFVDGGDFKVASFAPELFFLQDEDTVISKPMKGTAARGVDGAEDLANAEKLRAAPKEQAENLMIVDMIRNDLGRIARPGSVQVPQLFHVERHPNVLQMTSTVAATIDGSVSDVFGALFPCASIVGAPKIETMKIIRELEDSPRGLYTGAIGLAAPGRRSQFSVAIRTIVEADGQREFGVGSGIVWDSDEGREWAECELKAGVLSHRPQPFALVETFRWNAADGFFLLDRHLSRLAISASALGMPFDESRVLGALSGAAARFDGPKRVRLLLDRRGEVSVEHQPMPPKPGPVYGELAQEPVQSADPLLRHKTTSRQVYNRQLSLVETEEVLLWNERGELTEFSIGNLVLEIEGALLTPPLESGVLPGVLREELLSRGEILERVLLKDDVTRASRVFRINSVSDWVTVSLYRRDGTARDT